MKWLISLSNGYCGIVDANTVLQARRIGKAQIRGCFGEPAEDYDPDIIDVKPATWEDESWVTAMGGPKLV